MFMAILGLLSCLILNACAGLSPQEGTHGVAAYPEKPRGDEFEGLAVIYEKATQGDSDAQLDMAIFHEKVAVENRDLETAFRWYELAAHGGEWSAQAKLAISYQKGIGVPKDPRRSFKWSLMLAEQGNVIGESLVALKLIGGFGTEKKPADAIPWLEKAAAQEVPVAQFYLGVAYEAGWGNVRDLPMGFNYFRKAAENGDLCAHSVVGAMYLAGLGVAKDLKQAESWLRKAAAWGHAPSQFHLAHAIIMGEERTDSRWLEAAGWLFLAKESPAWKEAWTLPEIQRMFDWYAKEAKSGEKREVQRFIQEFQPTEQPAPDGDPVRMFVGKSPEDCQFDHLELPYLLRWEEAP